jgi:hypothetical protein
MTDLDFRITILNKYQAAKPKLYSADVTDMTLGQVTVD